MKILVGAREINRGLIIVDLWKGIFDHFEMKSREDCPACIWQQMSQEADDGPSTAELINSSLIVTGEIHQFHDGLHRITCDISVGTPIRAPPSL